MQQLEYLRHQIDMRVIGLGWDQFKTKWSAKGDPTIGTVTHLRALLVDDILPHERAKGRLKRLPTEAAPPQFTAKELGQLGSANADALAIRSKALFSTAELKAKAEAAVKRREEAGISDRVERLQQKEAPAFDQKLVGKRVEVLWRYINKDTNEPILIWATGRVTRVADGLTDTKTKRGKALLPAGAVLWAWDADPEFGEAAGEQWLTLLPKKWNPSKQGQVYSWRFTGALTRASSRAPQLRRRLIRGAAMPHACRSRPNENTHACYVTLLYILLAPVRRKCMCATPHVPAVMSMRLLRSFIAYLKIPIPAVNSQKEPSRAPKRLISELLI